MLSCGAKPYSAFGLIILKESCNLPTKHYKFVIIGIQTHA